MDINKVYLGDCLEIMPSIPDKSIDLILCDLPYGTTACKWDTRIPLEPLWKEYKRVIKKNGAIVLTASQPFTSILVMSNIEWFKYEWIWDKGKAGNIFLCKKQPMKYHENVLIFSDSATKYNPVMTDRDKPVIGKNRSTGRAFSDNSKPYEKLYTQKYPKSIIYFGRENYVAHPTQKPVALFEYLIKTYTNENELVLDNCIGSGTTAIACINTNRHFIGCELDKGYYDIAVKRVEEARHKVKRI